MQQQDHQLTQSSGSKHGGASSQKALTRIQQQSLWQHPFVDVFKHFKIMPSGDWRQTKKQGEVEEIFAKEIGRKAMNLTGSISANNFLQLPHPTSLTKSLGLTGRYLYLQVKSPSQAPFSLHFDFSMAERGNNIRVSVSNLFKTFNQSSGFVVQVPLELEGDRWTCVCLDVTELMTRSGVVPASYNPEGAHQLKSMTLCSTLQIRGVYTSDNDYDFVTLPSDLRFKFPFDNSAVQVQNKWLEYFDWQCLPGDWIPNRTKLGTQEQLGKKNQAREEERSKMSNEINQLLSRRPGQTNGTEEDMPQPQKRSRLGKLPELADDHHNNENLQTNNFLIEEQQHKPSKKQTVNLGGLSTKQQNDNNMYGGNGSEFKRSPKLNMDPIIELRHIIGYSPDRCLNLRWSRFPNDPNVVLFTSGGTLIAMDIEANQQKRFFFGHSAPICCFDVNANGALLASAQEGKNSIIRVWEYTSGRCISMMTMPVTTLKCLAFSYDGKYLASVGKDSHNKELIIVWDITRIGAPGGGKPEIVAKQTSDFNIINLRFSPIDSSRMASCGKENIRFWRIKDNGSIRGSAVVLNHHARNTVFTCLDFEYGLRAVDPKENESLKRLFVGSKHGMVFQVNYHTESLEATYQTNDSAIYGISVNEAFCVTGSEDTYMRVWPLDFSEFFMEAKHEGTVGAVEISPDGLKVVCGTLNGSLGVLDKSNQKYRTFLRSHTDQILSLDYHLGKRIVITVSRDHTIRLWDLQTSDQIYEFSSPVDQALCVAAHPTLPLFSCGFESGVMRVFDIERTCVADEFCQFNKPVAKVAYSQSGDLLVTCCVDGGVAIHNPRRQHLPIKMLHLEFPPEFVHVAFTQMIQGSGKIVDNNSSLDFVSDFTSTGNESSNEISRFAVMGDYGNSVTIYDAKTFIVSHQIHAHLQVKQFAFANNNRELVVMTSDCRLRFYSLARYEGLLLRELSAVHRGSINAMSVSGNSGYLMTGGEDSLLKVWDYEAQKSLPYFFQAFIGHTYPVRGVMFCPSDNSTIMTIGDKDGIYLWTFNGDIRTQFAHQAIEEGNAALPEQVAQLGKSKSGSVLEKLRNTKKEDKQRMMQASGELKEGSFILPSFKAQVIGHESSADKDNEEACAQQQMIVQYQAIRRERGLTYNHFCGTLSAPTFDLDLQPLLQHEEEKISHVMNPSVMAGFDGFGGVHDNLVWCQEDGWMAYTLHNKVIFEQVKTREQTVCCDSTTQLSTIALSMDKKLLAVGEGRGRQNSLIYVYDTLEKKLLQRYTFHQRGVQSLAFSNNGQYLISVGVQGENNLAIWDLQSGLVVRSCLIKNTNAVNTLRVDPYIGNEDGLHIQFALAGNQGLFNIYRYEVATQQLQAFEVDNVPLEFQQNCNFTSLDLTQLQPNGTYYAILGASDGSMTAYDMNSNHFIDAGEKKWCISGEIGHARCNNQSMVVASSSGTIAKFGTSVIQMFPTDPKQVLILRAEGPVVALAMDDLNNEGIVGTSLGALYYINFTEKLIIKIVNKAYCVQKPVTSIKFNEANPQLIISNCTSSEGGVNGSGLVKVWTAQTLDQVMKFSGVPESAGPAAFVLSGTNGAKHSLVAHQGGLIRLMNLESLKIDGSFKIPLINEEEILTAGVFNPNGINFAVGTNLGQVYLGSLRDDAQGKPKVLLTKLEFTFPQTGNGVTSLAFSQFDPIGSFLVTFDNGIVRTWQSSVRNEQFMKLLELQQHSQVASFDLSEGGFQQFDLIDTFDMFENPHGLDELGQEDKQQLKLLYSNKRHRQCEAMFSPAKSSVDIYLSMVSSLQYIYMRNYVQGAIVKRVSLMHFPTCFACAEFDQLFAEDSQSQLGGEQILAVIGSKEGKVITYKISSAGSRKLSETRGGLSYGGISALDISTHLDKLVAATESGEIFTADLLSNIE